MLRHVGKISNTDERCVIAFMQIPGRSDHALVIPTDTLPPRFEQAVMDVVKSPEGQEEETFAIALSRRLMPDTGKDIFATLHASGMLRAVPVALVIMLPLPNQPIRLVEILSQLGRMHETTREPEREKFNPHTTNMNAENSENRRGIGRNLLLEAEMLESEAARKRTQAYTYDPSLKPKIKMPEYDQDRPRGSMIEELPPIESVIPQDNLTELLSEH
jgi:hypothetical protein